MKILIINAHPDPHNPASATNRMVRRLLEKLSASGAESDVLNLAEADIQPLDKTLTDAFVATLFEGRQPDTAQAAALARAQAVAAQLKSSPRVVIAMPLYNFGIPARLKDWIDNIVMPGVTFRYTEQGTPEGLMGTHKALILQGSGSVYSSEPLAQMEFSLPYLQALLGGFLGFQSVDVVRAEGTAHNAEAAVQKALSEIEAKIAGFMAE